MVRRGGRVLVLPIALLMGPRGGYPRVLGHDLSGESLAVATCIHARRVLIVYMVLTVAAVPVLWPCAATASPR